MKYNQSILSGAAEVFHYFIVKSKNIPFVAALAWGLSLVK